jgi:hypothetical protein
MEAPDRLAANFESDIREASGGRADPRYFGTLAANAAPTIAWLQAHGIEFSVPTYYLSATSLRIQPVGGGKVFVERLGEAARQAGVGISYSCSVTRLVRSGDRMSGVLIRGGDGTSRVIDADAVILATGGFQGNSDMLRQHFGPRAAGMKLISPGSRFDTGDGIFLASELGATRAARVQRRSFWSILTALSSIRMGFASSMKDAASSMRPGRRSPATSRRHGRTAASTRSSTPACFRSKVLSALFARMCHPIARKRWTNWLT